MPGNLEFISPPFLISAPVIQINSNEISRGKAPFGWGVCSSPQLSPIQWPFPWAKAEQPPPPPKVAPLQHVEEWIWGAVTHRHWVFIQKRAMNSSHGLRGFSLNSCISTQHFFTRNQRGRDKMETKFDKWTNSGGFDFFHSMDYRSCPLSGSWLEEFYVIWWPK